MHISSAGVGEIEEHMGTLGPAVMFSLFLLFGRSVSLLSNGRCCSW